MAVNLIIKKTFKEMYQLGRTDPSYFARAFLFTEPHAGQVEWLNNGLQAKERMLACGNRWGKSYIAAVRLIWRAFYMIRPEKYKFSNSGNINLYKVINVCHSLDQSTIVWNNALKLIRDSKIMQPFLKDVRNSPFPEMILSAPSTKQKPEALILARSTAKSANYLLGHTFNFINWDEVGFDANAEAIFDRVLKMRLIDQAGDIDFTSSPNGKNWFYRQFERGARIDPKLGVIDSRYYSRTGPTRENTNIALEELDRIRDTMSESYYRANVLGEFVDNGTLFPADKVENCYKNIDYSLPVPPDQDIVYKSYNFPYANGNGVVENLTEYKAEFVDSKEIGTYVMGVDLARNEKGKGDKTCIAILRIDKIPYELVYFKLLGDVDWEDQVIEIYRLTCKYHTRFMKIDKTGIGQPAAERLLKRPGEFEVAGEGINFTGTKDGLLGEGQNAIQKRQVTFPYIKELVNSLILYQDKDKGLFTDPVFALCLAISAANQVTGRGKSRAALPVLVMPTYAKINKVFTMEEQEEEDDDGLQWIPSYV